MLTPHCVTLEAMHLANETVMRTANIRTRYLLIKFSLCHSCVCPRTLGPCANQIDHLAHLRGI